MRKVKLSQWAKENNYHYISAFKLYQQGKLKTELTPTGRINVLVDENAKVKEEKIAIYCRVSSTQNKKNLISQKDRVYSFCLAKGYKIEKIVTEIGSGLNDTRPKWLALLKDESITKIVVEHKDIFTRFGFTAYCELLKLIGKEIEVISEIDGDKQDLIQDFISIITSYCARIYGHRSSKRRIEALIENLKNEK